MHGGVGVEGAGGGARVGGYGGAHGHGEGGVYDAEGVQHGVVGGVGGGVCWGGGLVGGIGRRGNGVGGLPPSPSRPCGAAAVVVVVVGDPLVLGKAVGVLDWGCGEVYVCGRSWGFVGKRREDVSTGLA